MNPRLRTGALVRMAGPTPEVAEPDADVALSGPGPDFAVVTP
ncbi:hypothetical protein V1J52_00540 [Streptomyces sp. TRM 70351]|nr:hypothetical protein [Streptomyces sp. TRM 70351]MEE1926684.1 hypothetical protein [Streptomyces sp. TRM 70351]